ncbi:MAG TPA: patatin-like phospholipase family protein [Thermoanaerobaculia bacterium]
MRHSFGLVLSGGGSRGLAHAGVLAALAEHGLAPDVFSGTSAGALVAALHLAGHDHEAILDFFERTSPFHLSHLAPFGKPGWLDTEKIEADFRRFFPDDAFEALAKPLFVSATDLVNARLEVFSSGPLIRPLLASASIPMLFTPTPFNGNLYADGGILDNFPTRPLAGLCSVTLGVYVSPLHRVAAKTLDTSLAVTQRAIEIGMYLASARKFRHVDLVLCPQHLDAYSTLDPKRHVEIFEIGYRAADERMDEIVALVSGAD